ncbi:glutamate 5-kinase-like protein [Thermochaetoides thermophila DSM 1495]|uniref:Glutamate 5-kinase-like protein n=1 Tax=Chaetomium thermophilum (strain DSM 1495 / CBS 144.50 / IMI 039719) TaxID=759272 RepID=G0S436_CHATD|nr:glutamate 5-kinase-like protein [Thermochaetoides thermophila DSM 1495]EGS20412.1 glutamate 5-kinase-like protein [Thermochaetoides thermophila DSM 1495]
MRGPRPLGVVIKLGTSSIVDEKTHEPLLSILTSIVETAVKLRKDGHRVVIVSSGAIGVGLRRMDVDKRPKQVSKLQALAAIGQCRLMSLWDSLFNHLRQPIAQILLTRNDISDRSRYLNAQRTFNELLDMGVIPIVNENDTLAVSEIKFGDNDTLSAITAAMVHADLLFLMTDVDCLYDKNPRTNPDAQPIEVVEDIGSLVADVSSAGSSLGTGGMSTKIVAARLATSAGVMTIITRSSNPGNIIKIVKHVQASRSPPSLAAAATTAKATRAIKKQQQFPSAETPDLPQQNPETNPATAAASAAPSALATPEKIPLHTRFLPSQQRIRERHFWILHGLRPHGTLYIDQGAYRALVGKAGLLPVGVVDVEGTFAGHEAVRLVVVERVKKTYGGESPTSEGEGQQKEKERLWVKGTEREVGRALTEYSSAEILRIKGHQSSEIEKLLGYADSEYVAQRGSVSLFETRPATPVRESADRKGDESDAAAAV